MKTWIKLYTEILSDPKMGRMNDKLFRRTIELFLIAGKEDNGGILPSIDSIAWTLRVSEKEIQTTLRYLEDLKIIEKKSESYLITNFEKRQNSDLSRSEINRRYYQKSKNKKSDIQMSEYLNVRPNSDMTTSESQTVEVEVEEEVEVDKEVEGEVEGERVNARARKAEPKHRYGRFQHVLLTDDEYGKILLKFNDWERKIQNLDDYLENNRKKHYDNHYLTILNWARRDGEQKPVQPVQPKRESWVEIAERMAREEVTA